MKACKKKEKLARVHSIETFGEHEGPGIRFVLFLQGCRARCLYCQNPDTWGLRSGKAMTAAEIFAKLKRCLPYINSSNGGVTISGGEPLLQMDFLTDFLKRCKDNKIHTAIDTSAFYNLGDKPKLKSLLSVTDLFIVDIKAAFEGLHEKLTGRKLGQVIEFLQILEKNKKDYWIRYVLVPGLNDSKKDMEGLRNILKNLKFCRKFEFLPYHTLGKHKWEYLDLKYPLADVKPATSENLKNGYELLNYIA